ncbi:MAG: hypothetical protein PHV32_10975, partial [Eubacteriales bacterium]|nr:hypothetical protein [Eubacteriales bacterium]
IPIDSEGVYASHGEGAGWSSYIYTFGAKNTGKRHISFDVTPLEDGIDASVDFADYDVKTTNFQNLAMMVRFSTAGNIGVQSGASFDSLTEVKYTADTRFHVEIYADMSIKKYTVYITPEGGEEVMVAEDFGFRNSASQYTNDAGKMFIISAGKDALLRVENVTMEAYK